MKHAELTQVIIDCFFRVYNQLGYGFLKSIYKKAMIIEEHKIGLHVETEAPIPVYYDDQVIGEFFADQVVEGLINDRKKYRSPVQLDHQ